MTRVYCYNYDCIHLDDNTGLCCLGMISVEGAACNGCNDYKCYLSTKEYREEFYALMGNRDETTKRYIPVGREKRYGKKIEYNGRVFYSESKLRRDNNISVTDAKTGFAVHYAYALDHWDKFIEIADKQADIESFPIVTRGKDGKCYVVEEGGDSLERKEAMGSGAEEEIHKHKQAWEPEDNGGRDHL